MNKQTNFMIIGLAGQAGAGKDTVADYLAEQYGFFKVAFANPLKIELANAFSADISCFYDEFKKEKPQHSLAIFNCDNAEFRALCEQLKINIYEPQTPRRLSQLWGTEFRRNKDSYYWIDKAKENIHEAIRQGYKNIVITDVRFNNEANLIKEMNGTIALIKRNFKKLDQSHESEQLNNIKHDLILDNSKDLDHLFIQLDDNIRLLAAKSEIALSNFNLN